MKAFVAQPAVLALRKHLARADRSAAIELAAVLSDVLFGSAAEGVSELRLAFREVALRRSSPTFPGAIVVADGADAVAPSVSGTFRSVRLDVFLATKVMLLADHAWSVQEVITRMQAPEKEAAAGDWPAFDACIRAIARVVLNAMSAVEPPAGELKPLVAHHTAPPGASLFVTRDAVLRTPGIDAELEDGLSWAMSGRLVRSRSPRRSVFYELGDLDPRAFLLSVSTLKDNRLHVFCRIGAEAVLELATQADELFSRLSKIVAIVDLRPSARLRLWVNDVLIGSARAQACRLTRVVGQQSIGAGLLGRYQAALFLRELLVVGRPLDLSARRNVSLRLDRNVT
jgi:hypothetical protein